MAGGFQTVEVKKTAQSEPKVIGWEVYSHGSPRLPTAAYNLKYTLKYTLLLASNDSH